MRHKHPGLPILLIERREARGGEWLVLYADNPISAELRKQSVDMALGPKRTARAVPLRCRKYKGKFRLYFGRSLSWATAILDLQ